MKIVILGETKYPYNLTLPTTQGFFTAFRMTDSEATP